MIEFLCTVIAIEMLIIAAFVRDWWRREDERERDEALRREDAEPKC